MVRAVANTGFPRTILPPPQFLGAGFLGQNFSHTLFLLSVPFYRKGALWIHLVDTGYELGAEADTSLTKYSYANIFAADVPGQTSLPPRRVGGDMNPEVSSPPLRRISMT